MNPNDDATPTEHLLLFRGTGCENDLSPAELQATLDKTMAWFERLHEAGLVRAAQPLFSEGRIVSGGGGRPISDGPFAESKESVGGYLILRMESLDEATALARTWPLLDHGATVEVRPVAIECPSFRRLREGSAHAAAAST